MSSDDFPLVTFNLREGVLYDDPTVEFRAPDSKVVGKFVRRFTRIKDGPPPHCEKTALHDLSNYCVEFGVFAHVTDKSVIVRATPERKKMPPPKNSSEDAEEDDEYTDLYDLPPPPEKFCKAMAHVWWVIPTLAIPIVLLKLFV